MTTVSLDLRSLLTLSYDLLLQYPVHRLARNAKFVRPLTFAQDETLIAEETLTVDAFGMIESLMQQLTNDEKPDESAMRRLQKLLPLLLYRYRNAEPDNAALSEPVDANEETAAAKPMTIVRDRDLLRVLPFNFRPFNTGLRYNDWPLGRTKEVIIRTSQNDEASSSDNDNDKQNPQPILSSDLHYVAEPVDKLQWLRSKSSDDEREQSFDVAAYYKNKQMFFQKYAPRARALRKARFRLPRTEKRAFREFIFGTKLYDNTRDDRAAQWDWLWSESLPSLRFARSAEGEKRRTHLVAHLLALLQPESVQQSVQQVGCVERLMACTTNLWTDTQVRIVESLLRTTVYEPKISPQLVTRKDNILLCLVSLLSDNRQSGVALRSAALLWFTGLRSQFDAVFCESGPLSEAQGNSQQERGKTVANTFFRLVTALEQSVDVESAVHNTYIPSAQLWHLAGKVIVYLREQAFADNVTLQSIDFVSSFVSYLGEQGRQKLFDAEKSLSEIQITNVLINNV